MGKFHFQWLFSYRDLIDPMVCEEETVSEPEEEVDLVSDTETDWPERDTTTSRSSMILRKYFTMRSG